MSDGRISIDMTLQQSEVIAGLLKVLDKENAISEGFGKISKEAVKAERDMKRFVKSTTEAEMTPREVFQSHVTKLLDARKSGLDPETFKRAMQRANQDFRTNDPVMKKQAEDAKALTDATHRANAEMERLVENEKRLNATPLENYQKKMDSLRNALASGKMPADEFLKSRRRLLGEYFDSTSSPGGAQQSGGGMLSQVTAYAAGFLTLQTAVSAVTGEFDRLKSQRLEGHALSQGLKDYRKDLVSVSGSAQELSRNNARAALMAGEYAVSPQESMSALFMAKSGGFSNEETKAMMDASYIQKSPAMAANVMVKARGFKGVSGRQALNMVGVASKDLPATTEEVATFLPQALSAAQMAGFQFEEALAIIGELSKIEKNFGVAADRAKAMFGKISLNRGLMKGGGGMDALRRASSTSGAISRYFKDDFESRSAAYNAAGSMDKITSSIQNILQAKSDTGGANDYLDASRGVFQSDPILRQQQREQVAVNRAAFAKENAFSNTESRNKQMLAILSENQIDTKAGFLSRLADSFNYGTSTYFGQDITKGVGGMLLDQEARLVGKQSAGTISDDEEVLLNKTRERIKEIRGTLNDKLTNELRTKVDHKVRKGGGYFMRTVHGIEEKKTKPAVESNNGAGSPVEQMLLDEMSSGVSTPASRRNRSVGTDGETTAATDTEVDQYLRRNSGAGFKSSQAEVAADPQLQESNLLLSQMLEVQKQTLGLLKSGPQQEVRNNRAVTEQDTVRRSR